MPADSNFEQALILARQLHDPAWAGYASYLTLRGKGLRQAALQQLATFLATARTWAFTDRWRFTVFLLEHLDGFWTRDIPLPQPLVAQGLRPTLHEGVIAFPDDPRPPYWLAMDGIFAWQPEAPGDQRENWLRMAIARDPKFQSPRLALTRFRLSEVAWHQHELPWGYLGDPSEDLKLLREAQSLLRDAGPTAHAGPLDLECQALVKTATQYLAYKASGGPFYRDWCDTLGLPYRHEEAHPG